MYIAYWPLHITNCLRIAHCSKYCTLDIGHGTMHIFFTFYILDIACTLQITFFNEQSEMYNEKLVMCNIHCIMYNKYYTVHFSGSTLRITYTLFIECCTFITLLNNFVHHTFTLQAPQYTLKTANWREMLYCSAMYQCSTVSVVWSVPGILAQDGGGNIPKEQCKWPPRPSIAATAGTS